MSKESTGNEARTFFMKMFWIGAIPALLPLVASPWLTRWARARE